MKTYLKQILIIFFVILLSQSKAISNEIYFIDFSKVMNESVTLANTREVIIMIVSNDK